LERIGLHTLAEPNHGDLEKLRNFWPRRIPVPVGATAATSPSNFKQLARLFTPVVLSRGASAADFTEVSELTIRAPCSGTALPTAWATRSRPTITLPASPCARRNGRVASGGSLAIGGLIQQQTKQNLDSLAGA
jgi:Flp pilus assembly secretin CpaC